MSYKAQTWTKILAYLIWLYQASWNSAHKAFECCNENWAKSTKGSNSKCFIPEIKLLATYKESDHTIMYWPNPIYSFS